MPLWDYNGYDNTAGSDSNEIGKQKIWLKKGFLGDQFSRIQILHVCKR